MYSSCLLFCRHEINSWKANLCLAFERVSKLITLVVNAARAALIAWLAVCSSVDVSVVLQRATWTRSWRRRDRRRRARRSCSYSWRWRWARRRRTRTTRSAAPTSPSSRSRSRRAKKSRRYWLHCCSHKIIALFCVILWYTVHVHVCRCA